MFVKNNYFHYNVILVLFMLVALSLAAKMKVLEGNSMEERKPAG